MTGEAKSGQGDWQPATLYALGFLVLVATFNYLDRGLLGLALPAIKQEMQVSDPMLGFVSGIAFVLFYSILGIPIAWAADRYNRRNIIAIGFAFWSLMTMLTGFVSNIWQLAAARFLMGAGEAAGLAPSTSMISDLFRPGRRPLAMAIFGTAGALSGIVFFPVMGWIGQNHGWRSMFVVAGIPSVLLALVFVLTVREPVRGGRDATSKSPSVAETARFLASSRAYVLLVAGATFMGADLFADGSWTPTFLSRVHGMSLSEVAVFVGTVRGILTMLGSLTVGVLIDRLGRDRPKMRARIPAIACVIAGPAQVLFLLADSGWLWIPAFTVFGFCAVAYQGPVFALGTTVVRPPMRAVATSIMVVSAALLGQVVGPLTVGFLNDTLAPEFGTHAIRYSLLIGTVTPLIAAILFWLAGNHLEADSARATAGS